MSHQEEVDRLLQTEWREKDLPVIWSGKWIHAYRPSSEHKTLRSVLIPKAAEDSVLRSQSWSMNNEGFIFITSPPGFSAEDNRTDSDPFETRSSRWKLEPLVIERHWHGLRSKEIDIHQEFRLYHNLWFDEENSMYLKFDSRGDNCPVIRLSSDGVKISRREIRQFLAEENLTLGIFFERQYLSHLPIDAIAVVDRRQVIKGDDFIAKISAHKHELAVDRRVRSISIVSGRKLIKGKALEDRRDMIEDKSAPQLYKEFIVGADEDGEDVFFTCDPSLVDPLFPKKHSSHHSYFLTSVYFRRRVLDKYEFESTYVRCGDLWGLPFHYSKQRGLIKVLLGDLGNLPTAEQFHWKGENVQPIDNQYFESTIIAEYARNSKKFKFAYTTMQDSWRKTRGWDLFKPLRDSDSFDNIKYLSNDTPLLFESFVLSMSKLLVDSINIKDLRSNIPNFNSRDSNGDPKRGITILAEYLSVCGYDDSADHIGYLRKVQALRSSSAAHRKGKNYEKTAKFFSLSSKSTVQVADDIFTTLTEFLESLREHFCLDESD